MFIASPLKYGPSDIVDAEQRYAETKDPMFLALAVGARPHLPPLWVIEACAALAERIAGQTERGNTKDRTGQRLDEMWRYFFAAPDNFKRNKKEITSNKGPSVASAARYALNVIDKVTRENVEFASAMRVLEREWQAEQKNIDPSNADFELFDGLRSTPRMSRIMAEWGDKEGGIPFRHVSLHIARFDREAK